MEILNVLIGIIAFILILSIIVIVHEGGHFLFAKKAGILCHEFAIGMGPVIWQKKKGETTYSLRAIPIGGFVSMAGEEVEMDLLRDVKKVRLQVNDSGIITKIIVNINNPKYTMLPLYNIVKYDIMGTSKAIEDELYMIVKAEDDTKDDEIFRGVQYEEKEIKYQVLRTAMVNIERNLEVQIAPLDRNFSSKSLWQRFISVFAGPLANFLLAIFLYFIIGLIMGYANTADTKVNKVEENTPIYAEAVAAGINPSKGDKIISINGKALTDWDSLAMVLDEVAKDSNFNGYVTVDYLPIGESAPITLNIRPRALLISAGIVLLDDKDDPSNTKIDSFSGRLSGGTTASCNKSEAPIKKFDKIIGLKYDGVYQEINTRGQLLDFFSNESLYEGGKVEIHYLSWDSEQEKYLTNANDEAFTVEVEVYSKKMLNSQGYQSTKLQIGVSAENKFNLLKTLYMPFVQTGESCFTIFRSLGLLFTDSTVGLGDFSGPVGIFQLVSVTASQGIMSLLSLMALLSVNIGFVNLLPLPALDGGRIAFIGYEAITRRKPNAKVENIIHTVGFLLLMLLFIFISFNDVIRCVTSW